MKLTEQIFLDSLCKDAVSVRRQSFLLQNGHELPVGDVHRMAFVNSASGRELLQGCEIDERFKQAIFAAWGDEATVTEPVPGEQAGVS